MISEQCHLYAEGQAKPADEDWVQEVGPTKRYTGWHRVEQPRVVDRVKAAEDPFCGRPLEEGVTTKMSPAGQPQTC